jgi:uncharacterized protein with GYD domain
MDMPFYLHQWNYKDQYIKKMMLEPEDRADVVRTATAAFGGTLHSFFYCFGRYDGVAISEFPDSESALACLMAIFGQGRISGVHTTTLFSADEGLRAMFQVRRLFASQVAEDIVGDHHT